MPYKRLLKHGIELGTVLRIFSREFHISLSLITVELLFYSCHVLRAALNRRCGEKRAHEKNSWKNTSKNLMSYLFPCAEIRGKLC